jgi:hypothetical protein
MVNFKRKPKHTGNAWLIENNNDARSTMIFRSIFCVLMEADDFLALTIISW